MPGLLKMAAVLVLILSGVGMLLGSLWEAALRLAAIAAGWILTDWMFSQRLARIVGIAVLWLGAAGLLALVPEAPDGMAPLVVPPALWLAAVLSRCEEHPVAGAVWLRGALLLGTLALLALGRQPQWMLPFAAAASVLLFRRGMVVEVVLLGVVTLVVISLSLRHAQISGRETVFPAFAAGACWPRAWLVLVESGWLGGAPDPVAAWAPGTLLANRWGWLGLGMVVLGEGALIAVVFAIAASMTRLWKAALPWAVGVLLAGHLGLHFLFWIGSPLGLSSLPFIGSPVACLFYTSLLGGSFRERSW